MFIKPKIVNLTCMLVNECFMNVHHALPHLCLLLVEPIITEITGNIVREGGNVTLNCSGNGKPAPSFKWTRLSDNHAVTMPLININRHDARDYRCTADNGVGIPATKDVNIDVQCRSCSFATFMDEEQNISLNFGSLAN